MKGWQRLSKGLLAFALCFTGVFSGFKANVKAATDNLAQGKAVTASNEYSTMPASNLTDGNDETRWSSESGVTQWAYVDLGESKTMNKFEMKWESSSVYASSYNIYVSDDTDNWGTPVVAVTDSSGQNATATTQTSVSGRYVKLEVTQMFGYNSVSCYEFKIFNDPKISSKENLALGKNAVASQDHPTMPASYLTDGDETTRWSAEGNVPQWIYVDLGASKTMNKFETLWQNSAEYGKDYKIYVSDSTTNWGDPVAEITGNTKQRSTVKVEDVTGRYVKLEVTAVSAYPNVSCNEFKIFKEIDLPQDPMENIALNQNVAASSQEAASVRPELAVDGDTSSHGSRWGSNLGDSTPWIYVDLGKEQDVKTIKLFWENRKATKYQLQIADMLSNPVADSDWTTVKSFNKRPVNKTEKIILDNVERARYVRLYIEAFDSQDPDSEINYGTVSLYEIEIYGGEIKAGIDDVANAITVDTPAAGDTKLSVNLPNENGFTVTYNGTDLEQIVDSELNIYKPIVDKEVTASFKVTNDETGEYIFKEISVTIPGTNTVNASDNAAPNILPELQEWKGKSGTFSVAANAKVVYANDALKETAEALAADYKEITGKTMSVAKGSTANAGEILLSLTSDKSKGLQDEGYLMDISDKVTVEAETATGAFWATRTILQSIKQTGDIPCGITRDYPLYKVRGFILDVGRKTFTMDYLEQVVKMMSWYKMNDFQIHLNDNLIPLENLGTEDKIMKAYSAFRLESDIKAGGNNGLNKADLTSTDVFYTKDEFRNLIKESRIYGVNIVPEIDTPAHSLALTKVRPDLRHGTKGRENDHLNLTTKYAESLEFVQSIFNEYMSGSNPVFDSETTIQVGADEYTANSNAYRRFANDMLKFVSDSGRQARIWGSLTSIKGDVEVRGEGIEMNLWNGGWADMREMYDLGFDLINCNDGDYYIVPNAGYYYDYLNESVLYDKKINQIGGNYIPAGDEKMIGGAFAVWNDMTDYLENGISEYDVYDRIKTATALFGAKLWGKGGKTLSEAKSTAAQLGDGPDTNFGYEVDSKQDAIVNYPMDDMSDTSGNGYDLTKGVNASIAQVDGKNALKLNGNESYVNTPLTTVGLNNDLRVKVKRTASRNDEQILFESDYGTFKAVQKGTGKVGFSRENRDYSFDYKLPVNEWVELEFKNQHNVIELYVNGTKIDAIGDGEKTEGRPLLATAMFPVARIGSKTNSFIGYVDDVRIGADDTFNSTMTLDYALINANAIDNADSELSALVEQAKNLLKEYAPAAKDIEDMTDAINNKLNSMEFEKADYSAVDKYLALVPQDKSVFSDESVARLDTVINSIRQDLPASMQSTVDGYAKSLAAALQALETKVEKNVDYIDSSTLTATASSFQNDGGSAPGNVLDGDLNTMWHTDWSITTGDHWINLEMAAKSNVNGLTYVPRSNGGNGTATQYEIQVSDDGQTYRTVKSGTLAQNNEAKVIEFEQVNTKHVRFVIKKGVGGNGSAAEIMIHNADAEADVNGLNALIQKAEAIKNDGFTASSWQALQSKIAEAKALTGQTKPAANDVEIMKRELSKVMTALEYPAEKSILKDLIAKAEKLNEKDYTAETWAKLRDMLAEAKVIDGDESAIQETVDIIVEKLQLAIDELVKETVDKSELTTLVNTAKAIDTSKYTDLSVSILHTNIAYAESVLNNPNATHDLIKEAFDNLKNAIENLKEASTDNIILEAPKHGVSVTAPAGVLDPNTVLQVLEVEDAKNITAAVKKTLAAIKGKYTAFDVTLLLNGKEVQPKGTITISMTVPKGYDVKKLGLYHISDDGKMTAVKFTVKGNKIVFKTNHLSVYALVQFENGVVNPIKPNEPLNPDNNETLKPGTAGTPNTGDSTMLSSYAWICLCAGAVVLFAYKKRRQNEK